MPESHVLMPPVLGPQFAVWIANRHPEVLVEYNAESEKRDTIAALERTMAEATEELRRLRTELGETAPFINEVAPLTTGTVTEPAKPEPKKRAPRKPKPAPEPKQPDPRDPSADPDLPPVKPEPDDGDDFEAFEIPADDADDEF